GAAVLGRDERREPAGLGERIDEGLGIGAVGIDLAVVFVGELGAEVAQRVADFLEAIGSLGNHLSVSLSGARRAFSRNGYRSRGSRDEAGVGESSPRRRRRTIIEFGIDPSVSAKPWSGIAIIGNAVRPDRPAAVRRRRRGAQADPGRRPPTPLARGGQRPRAGP